MRPASLLAALIALSSAGCPSSRPAKHTQGPGVDLAALVKRADQSLARAQALDYRMPRDTAAHDKLIDETAALYLAACDRGDDRSCWIAGRLGTEEDVQRVTAKLGKSCLAKPGLACRALKELLFAGFRDYPTAKAWCDKGLAAACLARGERNFPDDPHARTTEPYERACTLGDSYSCHYITMGSKEDRERTLAAARIECDRGYPRGCAAIDDDVRMIAAATEGCQHDVIDECSYLSACAREGCGTTVTIEALVPALRQQCLARATGMCEELAELHSKTGKQPDVAAMRDALELGCQLGEDALCLDLARRYAARELKEPVTGRGKDLATYLCEKGDGEACALAEAP